jgi:16S rRNA processing protein RimM
MLLVVGQIIRAHGVHGEAVVDVRTDEPAQRFAAGTVLITEPAANRRGSHPPADGAWQLPPALTVESVRPHQGRLLITFDGINDRDTAENLRGVRLCVDSADVRAPADPDEFNDHQLIGLAAVTEAGEPIGEVIAVDHAPASDLLVLKLSDGRTGLVPFVKAIVPTVDVAAGRVVMAPPPGLFDL